MRKIIGNLIDNLSTKHQVLVVRALIATEIENTGVANILEFAKWDLVHNSNPKTRVGQCRKRDRQIEVHPELSPKDYEETLLHEIAHALAHIVYGADGHGRRCKQLNALLGQPNEARCAEGNPLNKNPDDHAVHYSCLDCRYTWHRHRYSKVWECGRAHSGCRHKKFKGRLICTRRGGQYQKIALDTIAKIKREKEE